jgi:hypothetical protein
MTHASEIHFPSVSSPPNSNSTPPVDPPEAPLLFERNEGNDGTVDGAIRTCAGSPSANTLQERENAGINSENRIEKLDESGQRRIMKKEGLTAGQMNLLMCHPVVNCP